MKEFNDAKEIIHILNKYGHEGYIVGGAIRNLLLNKQVVDIDIATSATPEKIKEIFPKVIPVGLEHGTVIVRHKGASYELTTYRNGNVPSENKGSIMKDLQYRDFTINAMALKDDNTLIDPFDGQVHIKEKKIKAVESPIDRLKEDPLRIIRALRFASELNFTIEETTLKAMKQLVPLLKDVAIERIKNEFSLLYKATYVKKGLDYLVTIKGYNYIPVFNYPHFPKELLKKNVTAFVSFSEVIAFYHLLHNKITINTWIRLWKASNKERNEAINLCEAMFEYEKCRLSPWLLYKLENANILSFIHLVKLLKNVSYSYKELKEKKQSLPIQTRSDLAFNGKDIMALLPTKKPGPWMNKILRQIEYKIVNQQLKNNKEQIKEWILCHPPEAN